MGTIAEISARKRNERDNLLAAAAAHLGPLTPADEAILRTSASDLVAGIKGRKWTSEAVVSAFIRSAIEANARTNCITEGAYKGAWSSCRGFMFDAALEDARQKDKELATGAAPVGEFFGLPASFKDTYNVVGVDTSLGCSKYCFQPTERADLEGSLVKLFRDQGGIPICKTGIPQTLLAFECSNPVWGAAKNPYSEERTCGGSSGGEAALITLKGSVFGFGSDIGGSLRIPAAYSGCCGLKPAIGRWPVRGQRSPIHGFDGLKSVTGPMARNVDDLTFAARGMIDATVTALEEHRIQADNIVPLPWREPKLPTKLKIGYWTDDGLIKTSPANVRAVNETVAALRALGHELVEFPAPSGARTLNIFSAMMSADGYKQLLGNIASDGMEPSMQLVTLGSRLPVWVVWVASVVVKHVLKDPVFAEILYESKGKDAGEYMHWCSQRDLFCRDFRLAAWEDAGLDFILCPPQAVPALEHGRTQSLSPLCTGTALFNVIDSTAGVLPVTRVDAERDAAPADYAKGYGGTHLLNAKVYGGSDPAYNSKKMAGLPVGVQLVGRSFEDEKVLAAMKIVEKAMNFK